MPSAAISTMVDYDVSGGRWINRTEPRDNERQATERLTHYSRFPREEDGVAAGVLGNEALPFY